MEQKSYMSFEVKAAEDEFGTITGYAGVFDVLDRGYDILKKGALGKKSITVPLMANHDEGVIGHATVTEDEKGLYYVGKLAVNSKSQRLRERAEEWYYAVKEGHISRNSFGYIPLETEMARKKVGGRELVVRELKRIDLFEVSIVPIPMNPAAGVSSVKSYTDDSIIETLSRLEERLSLLQKKLESQPEKHEPTHKPDVEPTQKVDISFAVLKHMGYL